MVRITMSELETDVRKFVAMAESQDVFVTEDGKDKIKMVKRQRNGKDAVQFIRVKQNGEQAAGVKIGEKDGEAAFRHFLSLYPKEGLDLDPEKVREERLSK